MAPHTIYLPDGQSITVTPVFAGLFFKSNALTTHDHGFPAGWTIVIHTEEATPKSDSDSENDAATSATDDTASNESGNAKAPHIYTFTKPTLANDSLFISSISNPSSRDFKPAASPTRQIAMMLWVTLYWYFNQPGPSTTITTEASKLTPRSGRPRGDWRVRIKRDGVLRGRNLIPKLERMGLIASYNSAVGTSLEDTDDMWSNMFVSQRMFWQIPGRLFLFTLQPTDQYTLSHTTSPTGSRPGSPLLKHENISTHQISEISSDLPGAPPPTALTHMPSFPIGPFFSASHLPTYYPPAPLQYAITNHIRHPLRPRPPRMGEIFYTRYINSVGQYLSFRVASISPRPVPYLGPIGPKPQLRPNVCNMSDSALLEQWHTNPRVSAFWGEYSPTMLSTALQSRHSFPVIGMWDGVPFGYFELYWVKEDILGRYAGGSVIDDFDRGLHVLIGEEWARGRVQSWLTSLVHWAFCADYRTMSVCLEPRVDNARFIQHLEFAGFTKEKEITFPHKQAWFGRMRRECWEGPAL
ncbi:acyl-CoA N-acyltransferase [Podospora fimiseda]|uniref:Acyl-CoA N-acyltransferase n=1 Tax=Podospora fimiseda TaxID=252190 RepID=A0AAN6YMW6_9PEZI|nr:acyl-CoA N-acyltransferase [Podospora fimiseda]